MFGIRIQGVFCHLFLLSILASISINCQPTDDCSIVINELNTDEPNIGSREYSEFIELKVVCPASTRRTVRLRDYLVIAVQEYNGAVRKPVVTFSADLYHSVLKDGSNYFVIASKEKQKDANMYFTDTSIGYKGKKASGLLSKTAPAGITQLSLHRFFQSASKELPTEPNALNNGNGKSAMAVILLHQRDYSRLDDATDSIGQLRLARMHSSTRRPVFQDTLTITDSMAEIIKRHLHDMIIYARSTQNNRCEFFESIYSSLRGKPDYILRPAREWDEAGHADYSINRCPTSVSEERKPLLFTRWKLGHLTPGEENDCSGAHWILEENIGGIVNAPPNSMEASTSSSSALTSRTRTESERVERLPTQCSASTHRSEMAKAIQFSEEIATNRDRTVQSAEIAGQGENAIRHAYCSRERMQDEKNELLNTDKETSKLQTELNTQLQLKRQSMKRSSCIANRVDMDAEETSASESEILVLREESGPPQKKNKCTGTSAVTQCETDQQVTKEWEDKSKFQEEWLDSLETHQNRHFSRKFVSQEMKTWFMYSQNSDDLSKSGIKCRFCLDFIKNVPRAALQAQQRKSSFSTEKGYIPSEHTKDSVRRKLQEHSTNALHREAIQWMKEKFNSILAKQIEQMSSAARLARAKRDEITARVLTSLYAEVKANVPYSSHIRIIELQEKNGLNMGTHHRHRKSATAMAASISTTMHNSLLKYIQGSKYPIAIVLDTTSDVHSNSYLMIYFRMLEESKPMMYFYRFKRLTEVETGRTIYDMLIEMFTRDNLHANISERLWGVTTDGASVMTGSRAGMISQLRPWAKNEFFQHHCAAHKLELAIYHAFETFPFMQHLDSNINALHKFYMRHAIKRKASLARTSEAMEIVFYELKHIYRIRWVASEVSALEVIRKSYYLLITNLENIQSPSSDFDEESKTTAAGLLNTLQNVRYYALHLFITDILKQLEFQSLQFQNAKGTFIGLQKRHRDLILSLQNLKTSNGPRLIDFLQTCKCRKSVGPGAEVDFRSRCHTNDLSVSNFLCTGGRDGIARYELKQPCSALRRQACSVRTGEEKFPALDRVRSTIIDSIVTQLQRYFPEDDYSIFDVLNPESLPTVDTMHNAFTYSANIIPLARRFGFQDDPASAEGSESESDSREAPTQALQRTISGQFNILIQSLLAHKVDFCAYRTEGPVRFWGHFLEMKTVDWLPRIKHLIQIVLTLPISSAEAERGFSIYKHVAYDRRSRLVPDNLEHLLRIRINGPPLSKFEPDKYLNDWLNNHWASDAPGGRGAQHKGEDQDVDKEAKSELHSGLF